jgi:FkbM family methyltransferase
MPSLGKSLIDSIFARLDSTIIANWRLQQYPQEQYMRRLIEIYGIDLIFDVGANSGQYAKFLRDRVQYRGRIVSYEPNPAVAAKAEAALGHDPLWTMRQVALGPAAGTAELNVMASDDFSSVLKPSTAALRRLEQANSVTRTISVPMHRIGDEIARLMNEHGCASPYLKLDTQGYDLMVLEGAGDALRHLIGIQSEMSVVPIYEDMPDITQSIARLRQLGFELSAVFPLGSASFPLLVEVDGHFVRTDLLDAKR